MTFEIDGQRARILAGFSMPEVLRVRELADALDLTAATVRRLCRRGTIPARKLGGAWFVSREALLECLVPRYVACADCATAVHEDVAHRGPDGLATCPDCSRRLRSAGSP